MGQAILYCFRCSTQLRESHFEQGKAFRIDARVSCLACVPEAAKLLPPDLGAQLLSQVSAGRPRQSSLSASSSVLRVPPRRDNFPAIKTVLSPSSRNANPLIVGGVAAGLVLLLLVIVLLSKSSSRGTPDSAPEPLRAQAPTPLPGARAAERNVPSSRDTPGALALANARSYARQHPNDLFGQLREFEDLSLQADPGEAGREARREVQSLRARGKELVDRSLEKLKQEISAPLAQEQFGPVFDALDGARARLEWPEWKLALDKQNREVRLRMEEIYQPIKTKALEAKAKGDAPTLESLIARVRGWGSRRLTDDLNQSLAAVLGPPVRVHFQDFEKDPSGWVFVGGQEFPGAKGSFAPDTTVFHGGRRSYKLQADFSGGGAYVGFWCDLSTITDRDIQEIHLWVKTNTVARVGVRLSDESNQCHQKNGGVPLAPTTEWQELVLKVSEMVGGEHWGGSNDGQWHAPAKGFGLNLGKGTFRTQGATQGALWIDDVDLVVRRSDQ